MDIIVTDVTNMKGGHVCIAGALLHKSAIGQGIPNPK